MVISTFQYPFILTHLGNGPSHRTSGRAGGLPAPLPAPFAGPSKGPERKQKTLIKSRSPFFKGRRNFPLCKGGLRGIWFCQESITSSVGGCFLEYLIWSTCSRNCQTLGVPRAEPGVYLNKIIFLNSQHHPLQWFLRLSKRIFQGLKGENG